MKGWLLSGGLVGALLVSGCLVHTPIVSSGKDTYVVSSRSSACLRCASAATALEAANQFCAKRGKSLVVRNDSGYMDPFGYNASNQLVFSCRDSSEDPAPEQAPPANGTIFIDPAHP
jgi:hypothetical protein